MERGLHEVKLVISNDHPSIRQAVMAELPGARWQRCVVRFERNVLAHMPNSERKEVVEDLREVFAVKRRSTAESLAQAFVERYRDRFKRAVKVFAQGVEGVLTYLDFSLQPPEAHQEHERAGAVVPGGETKDQGGGDIPQRKDPGQLGHGGGAEG